MEDTWEERGIWEYYRDEERVRNMGIWHRAGKREEYGNLEERREERGIWEYGRYEGRKKNMGIWQK